jgi:hypothetical protein
MMGRSPLKKSAIIVEKGIALFLFLVYNKKMNNKTEGSNAEF